MTQSPESNVKPLEYTPSDHDVGIVHLGIGAFHRAHQAAYTDRVLAEIGGDWRITGVSLRSTQVADALNAQDGRYWLVTRSDQQGGAPEFREIGSVANVLANQYGTAPIIDALVNSKTCVVSLTITEKAYGVDVATGNLNPGDPQISHDLSDPENPTGAIGLIVHALKLRRAADVPPFTVMSCDNLPHNGAIVRAAVVEFAKRVDPDLAVWISENVTFPATMVDRITPASTDALLQEVEQAVGACDNAAVETEPFCQWVIQDDFCNARPEWERVGALLVQDVEPYEKMKLRMLNGTHSMLAYAGYLSGCRYVRDVMAEPDLAVLVEAHMKAASATLAPLEGLDFASYTQELLRRFRNPNIAHETYQIAMDGSQKMPQRIFEPALDAQNSGADTRAFAFATASWLRYTSGKLDYGESFALRDPREAELLAANAKGDESAEGIVAAVFALPNLVPAALAEGEFAENLRQYLDEIMHNGIKSAIFFAAKQVK
ncbi:mannitol dehydrogenase family protein [Falsihalocynthiibacter sp. SS001]|uniref:mannitol dehydrogenase family protein n=1 Tax=Falsihalocynthiibacter sp. SS001 TaxID=3349698 RepID=UPI0036D27EE2